MKCNEKTKICSHLVTKQSFRHNLNQASNEKSSLTKVITFDIFMDNVIKRQKYAVIWSQNSHFITILTRHLIKKVPLKKLLHLIS